jgi:hypothetical protein
MVLLAGLLLAATTMDVQATGSNDGVCDGSGADPITDPDGEGAAIQCDVIAGPGSIATRNVVHFGVGACQWETTDLPLNCEGPVGSINGAGAATFGDRLWTGRNEIEINVEVTYDQQTCTDVNNPPCGFYFSLCNDRDQDAVCTNGGNDELWEAYTGGIFENCPDQKNCETNGLALEVCMNDSVFGDWRDNQIVVYVGNWAGTSTLDPNTDVGAGVGLGTYTVWVEDGGYGIDCQDPAQPDGQTFGLLGRALAVVRNPWSLISDLPDCMDLSDNDDDTTTDWPNDPGCDSPLDPGERGGSPCDDGADNDGDGYADYPSDPGCDGPSDTSERGNDVCDDGFDNDGDGVADYPADLGCASVWDLTETSLPPPPPQNTYGWI